ncbi:MAG TPA: HAD-IIIA family hydrolase [Microlunatus sp.]|nr:HAD-IIIA family hydrolase [Microlunatus sp.]
MIPTVGRDSLAALVAAIGDAAPAPGLIVVVDDRRDPEPPLVLPPLALPAVATSLRVLRSGGRGPAAARNVGWVASDSPWVAFLDDDVEVGGGWFAALLDDLTDLPDSAAASSARLVVPAPDGRRPTDEERRTTALAGARWITADMAYRRDVLELTGGFDERFPRAFREDSDLALRVVRAGYQVRQGNRVTVHPLRSRGGWRSSISAQAGNADNALLRAKFGPDWRAQIGEGPGRTGRHLLAVGAAVTALAGVATGRGRLTAAGAATWAAVTTEFAVRRILPGPRTPAEIATMIITSAAIPPVALGWRLLGELRSRGPRRRAVRAVLFDRDGTLIHDVPYLADPERVSPVEGAAHVLQRLRSQGIRVGVVSNQSGVARGLIRPDQLAEVNREVERQLGPFDTWQVCAHRDEDRCSCRKPAPGLVRSAARALSVRPEDCLMIGDIGADVQAALQAGARAVLVPTDRTRSSEVAHARQAARVAEDLGSAVDLVVGRT